MKEEFKVGDRIEWAMDGDFEEHKDCFDKDYYDTGEIVKITGDDLASVKWNSGTTGCCCIHNIRKLTQDTTEDTSLKAHKHKDLIIAWANGEEIEVLYPDESKWVSADTPYWDSSLQFRIEPKKKEPVVMTMFVEANRWLENAHNFKLKLTFDAESGKLLTTEVLDN